MRQVSLLFFCEKCAYQHELTPAFKDPDRDGPVFKCTDPGCEGTLLLKLDRARKLSQSRWVCSRTGEEKNLEFFCPSCSEWPKNPVRMKIKATTASYLKPLTYSSVTVAGKREIQLNDLEKVWSLSMSDLSRDVIDTFTEFGVNDVHIVDDVISYTVVYGYAPYGTDVNVRFFKHRNPDTNQFEYRAYISQSKGKGLIVQLDKYRTAKVVMTQMADSLGRASSDSDLLRQVTQKLALLEQRAKTNEVYEWIVGLTKSGLAEGDFEYSGLLFKLLHSIEHALTYQTSLQTGLEESAFAGKVLLGECSILIYERSQVEAGGVEYIAYDLLDRWLWDAIKQVRDCRYQCRDGCVKCLYVQDPLCHPLSPSEVPNTYILPNSLLSRRLLLDFWGIPADFETEQTEEIIEVQDD